MEELSRSQRFPANQTDAGNTLTHARAHAILRAPMIYFAPEIVILGAPCATKDPLRHSNRHTFLTIPAPDETLAPPLPDRVDPHPPEHSSAECRPPSISHQVPPALPEAPDTLPRYPPSQSARHHRAENSGDRLLVAQASAPQSLRPWNSRQQYQLAGSPARDKAIPNPAPLAGRKIEARKPSIALENHRAALKIRTRLQASTSARREPHPIASADAGF